MESLLVRVLLAIGLIWLVQVILGALEIKEPANKVLFMVTLLVAVIFIIGGGALALK